ncbi:MAG TPA: amidohydrolase family protein [Acidimicrobiales bacterium]|nr:amidohydrolase family protein [Acidimicrobiales bacterium]
MAYAEGRVIHDADSHVMEAPGWFDEWAAGKLGDRLRPVPDPRFKPAGLRRQELDRRHEDPEHRRSLQENIMGTKGWLAAGAYRKEDRPWALDLLGFSSQLVFTTAHLASLLNVEYSEDPDLAYDYARVHNEAMLDFCSVDPRLLPVCYLPLADIERSIRFAEETLAAGAAALMIGSACPRNHSPSHVGLDPIWARLQEARLPLVMHVGGGGKLMDPTYLKNGLPPVPDFTGGDGNFTSVSYMAISYPVMQTLATMIIDGVLDRFPELRIGVIEQGAAWVPGWMRSLDSAADAFHRNEERLQKLSLKPSEFVQRQIRVTPYPHEPAGWIIKNTGPTVCMFSSDYPHHEGGRNPLKRFESSMQECTEEEKDAFYSDNFIDMMGAAMDRISPAPKAPATA